MKGPHPQIFLRAPTTSVTHLIVTFSKKGIIPRLLAHCFQKQITHRHICRGQTLNPVRSPSYFRVYTGRPTFGLKDAQECFTTAKDYF